MLAILGGKALAVLISLGVFLLFVVIFCLCNVAGRADDKAKKILNAMKRNEKEGNNGGTVPVPK